MLATLLVGYIQFWSQAGALDLMDAAMSQLAGRHACK